MAQVRQKIIIELIKKPIKTIELMVVTKVSCIKYLTLLIFLLFSSCEYSQKSKNEKCSSLIKHEILLRGKDVCFLLPPDFSSECKVARQFERDTDEEIKDVIFNSPLNTYNCFFIETVWEGKYQIPRESRSWKDLIAHSKYWINDDAITWADYSTDSTIAYITVVFRAKDYKKDIYTDSVCCRI
ncbi:MAG: hypothetical protein LBV46_00515, partial [Bacteroidales bacterium]|nr:hypothetical protein [Bacteroidales bacterium]